MRQLQVALTPNIFHLHADQKSVVVVVDIFRATSVMCSAFFHGIQSIRPVREVAEALKFKGGENVVLVGERGGEKVDGFDEGNSPLVYHNGQYKGRDLVMTTTNGTLAIDLASKGHEVVIGSFLNLQKVYEYIQSIDKDVIIFCAGWKEKFNIEDTVFAGALSRMLLNSGFESNCDAAQAAADLYAIAENDLIGYLKNSNHYRRLERLGTSGDMEYATQLNLAPCLPVLKGEVLVNIATNEI